MEITIDQNSGFCFGVVHAIEAVEKSLQKQGQLYCLGDIVHNNEEVSRLKQMGMKVIDKETMKTLCNQNVLIRAHGEPPSTYRLAKENNLSIIDATCPVVLKLQKSVRKGFLEMRQKNGQVILFGKKGHAEVIGLTGQTNNTAIVVSEIEEINLIDFSKPSRLYAQTTQSLSTFKLLVELIKQKYVEHGHEEADFIWFDTICRQVSNREYSLKQFAYEHDVIIFVSGEKSSNGLVLFQICQSVNERSHMISSANDLQKKWFTDCKKTGVCGATSTPMWLMNNVAEKIKTITLQ
jgi:4-hydroxy-3-methylbut-2-enyl diphosphate reductase